MNVIRRTAKRHEAAMQQIGRDIEGIKALAPLITNEARFQVLLGAVAPALRSRVEAAIRPYLSFSQKEASADGETQH